MKHILITTGLFVLIYPLKSQSFKFGLDHALIANDFLTLNSNKANLNIEQMPRGMELGFHVRCTDHLRWVIPIRAGFGKAIEDTIGRNFIGIENRLQLEEQFGKVLMFVSTGIGAQRLSQKWDGGGSLNLGVAVLVDEGFMLTLSSNYRHSFTPQRNSWGYGLGLGFRFNPKKRSNQPAGNPIVNNPLNNESTEDGNVLEEFRADDEAQQNAIIVTPSGMNTGGGAVEDNDWRKKMEQRANSPLDLDFKYYLRLPKLAILFDCTRKVDTISSIQSNPLNENSKGSNESIVLQPLNTCSFESGQYLLSEEQAQIISAQLSRQLSFNRYLIIGYTDNIGTQENNVKLSARRAMELKKILIGMGISETQITLQFEGEANPIDSNETSTGRANNRRTIIYGY
jgi:outer membrane protein OmpA-like peptidoglycan-associated protein